MGGVLKAPKETKVDYDALARQRAEEERQKALERRRRGIDGNIKTSYGGVLGVKEEGLKRKKLLGE